MKERPAFVCPVCNATSYSRPHFARPDGTEHASSYFKCDRCDFAFTQPDLFRPDAENGARAKYYSHRKAISIRDRDETGAIPEN